MAEKDIRTKIVDYLNSLPYSDFEISPPGSSTGKPDITGCLNDCGVGRYVAIEVKIPGKKPRKAQVYRLNRLRGACAIAISATSLEEVKAKLSDYLTKNNDRS